MTVPTTDAPPVAALAQVVQRLSRRLRKRADLHLTASQTSALATVERHGELRLGELARLEQVGKSTMTRAVTKLEDAGYIRRWVDPGDGRVFLVALTDHGAAELREARSRQQAYLLRQFDALDAAERAALLDAVPALEKLLAVKA
ncbi:MAG TPA: MarR family transcriptional regulator [Rhodanobacteraceae bacterium]|nr:MarR family transcriptional regulator [Rhodanobacteraceae bacterium]